MIQSFVETPRRNPEGERPDGSQPPLWTVIFMGCLLINTVTFSFIPMSQVSSFDVAILFFVLVVFPLLFLSLFLANKFGYIIFFAAFLSIPGGIVSVLILGDFISILMGRNIIEDIKVRESTFYPIAKVFTFAQPILALEETFQSIRIDSILEGQRVPNNHPLIYYSLVPILDIDQKEGEEISAFAVCTHSVETLRDCAFHYPEVHGGFQVPENLRHLLKNVVRENEDKLKLPVKSSPIFLFWVAKPRERILSAGWYGLGFIGFLNLFWVGAVYFYFSIQKKI